jgi:hypothetical protein
MENVMVISKLIGTVNVFGTTFLNNFAFYPKQGKHWTVQNYPSLSKGL